MNKKILRSLEVVLVLFAVGCGNSVTRTIGPEGGTVTSEDGRLEIEVPAGAFSKKMEISIAPFDHGVDRGIGRGYRVTPEGALEHPVKLSFVYGDEELNGAVPSGLGIAFREGQGDWMAITNRVVDPGSRKVSVTTDHFSDWILFEMLFLEPSTAEVKATHSQPLRVMFCAKEDPESLITPLVPGCQPLEAATIDNWQVNGAPGGNSTLGTVTAQGASATFTAPRAIPASNPVTVSVDVALPGVPGKAILLSRLKVIDECPAPICRLVGTSHYRELISDTLWITGDAQVTWEFSSMNGTTATYVATGTATAAWEEADCRIALSPSSFSIGPTDGALEIDFSTNPPTYSGFGDTSDDNGVQTWTCPNSDPFEETGTGASWFKGSGTVVNGSVLEGSFTNASEGSSWSFSRP